MRVGKILAWIGGLAVAATAVGCSAEGTEETTAPAAVEGANLVYRDAFSATGVLEVVRFDDGFLGVGVFGELGVDDHVAIEAALAEDTLEQTYLALHPELTSAPNPVRELSVELAAQRAAVQATLPAQERARQSAIVAKDVSAFRANACVTVSDGFSGWSPAECPYRTQVHSICTSFRVGTRDRSIAWNESPYWGRHSLSGMAWVRSIPPWNFSYTEWGGSYSSRQACLALNAWADLGNLGITHHNYFTDVRTVPVGG